MEDSRNQPELETLSYKPKCEITGQPKCNCVDCNIPEPTSAPPAALGFNSAVIKPEMRVNKVEDAGQHPEQPIEFPKMDENTKLIVNACKQVVQSAQDYDNDVMTTPITVVQACEQLSHLITRIKKVQRAKTQRAADNAMTEGF